MKIKKIIFYSILICFFLFKYIVTSKIIACSVNPNNYNLCQGGCPPGQTCGLITYGFCQCFNQSGSNPQPTTGGYICTSDWQCMQLNCGCPNCISNCVSFCRPGNDNKNHCYTEYIQSNPTVNIGCSSSSNENWTPPVCHTNDPYTCSTCGHFGHSCTIRYCTNPPNSNQFQISCGCGGVSNPGPSPTPTPVRPWTKLRGTSFYSNKNLNQPIPHPFLISPYDSHDNNTNNFIIVEPGVVSAPSINLDNGNPSERQWKTTDSQNPIFINPSSFISYAKARTNLKTINNLNEIQTLNKQAILINSQPNSSIVINDSNKNLFNEKTIALLVNGNLDISVNGVFSPSNSHLAFIVNGNINFSPTTTETRGIYVAKNINTGETENQGLKIIGNLIAQENFINQRRWSTHKPSVFILFGQRQYLNLLPYISTITYEWKQTN